MSALDAGINGDDDADTSPWQPGTPPLTLLRLLGIGQSLDNDPDSASQRPPPPGSRHPSQLLPLKNLGANNRSSSSSSFLSGFSRPEVGSGLRVSGASLRARSGHSDHDVVDRKPEEANDAPHLPRLQITPGGKQRRPSRDRDVTRPVDDVTDRTKTGNTTDERHDSDLSTLSSASPSVTSPTSVSNGKDNITAAPEADSTSKDDVEAENNSYDYDGQSEDGSDDQETDDGKPYHGKHVPVWPVPQHHMTLYPPGEKPPFRSLSFDVFPPGQHPMFGGPGRPREPTGVDTAVRSVNLPSLGGQSSGSWNGVEGPTSDDTRLRVLSPPLNHAVRMTPNDDWELGGGRLDEATPKRHESGTNVEEELTTRTSTSQQSDEIGDSAEVSEEDVELASNGPTKADHSATMSSTSSSSSLSFVKTTTERSTERRGRIALWGPASWGRSTGVALSATTSQLLGMCVCVHYQGYI